jgi:hypothetical protein
MKKLRTASFDILGYHLPERGTLARAQIGWLVFVRWLPGLTEPECKSLTFSFPLGVREECFR